MKNKGQLINKICLYQLLFAVIQSFFWQSKYLILGALWGGLIIPISHIVFAIISLRPSFGYPELAVKRFFLAEISKFLLTISLFVIGLCCIKFPPVTIFGGYFITLVTSWVFIIWQQLR